MSLLPLPLLGLALSACGAAFPDATAPTPGTAVHTSLVGALAAEGLGNVRLLPLGASITYGTGSSTGNGYRAELYVWLKANAAGPLDFVGRQHSGTMADTDSEGYPGDTIAAVAGEAVCSVRAYQPNVVTLLAGTNDVNQNLALDQAPARLGALIDQILRDSPLATVIVSALPPSTVSARPELDTRINAYNAALPSVVKARFDAGKHVLFVNAALNAADVNANDYHPNDAGYTKLANAFIGAVQQAGKAGWLKQLGSQGTFAAGCHGDAPVPVRADERWEDHGVSFPDGFPQGSNFALGDVNVDGRPEYWVIDPQQGWKFYWNSGPTQTGWTLWGPGVSRAPRQAGLVGNQLRLTDLDGDGHADCVTVHSDGILPFVAFWNEAAAVGSKVCGTVTAPGAVPSVPDTGAIPADTQIVFADLNGDKRDDYLLVSAYGGTRAWLNLKPSTGSAPVRWQALGELAKPLSSKQVVRWADLNGDGRADQVLITPGGGARAWLNRAASNTTPNSIQLTDVGQILNDTGLPPADLRFADVSSDGAADLLRIGGTGVMHIWLNRLNPPYASAPLGASTLSAQSVVTAQASAGDQDMSDDPSVNYNPDNAGYQPGTIDPATANDAESGAKLINPDDQPVTTDSGSDDYQGSDVDQASLSD